VSGRLQLILPLDAAPADPAIDGAVALARHLDAEITVATPRPAASTHWLPREYAPLDTTAFQKDTIGQAQELRQKVQSAAAIAGVRIQDDAEEDTAMGDERALTLAARTHDLSILGLSDQDAERQRLAEDLLFDSGRPLLVVPQSRPVRFRFDSIALAWDHSEPASRVLSGALPLFLRARQVLVFSVLGAKRLPRAEAAADAAAYLKSHGVACTWEMLDSEDRARGRFIMETAIARGAGLLVMGAYATLPAQERLLGGVTVSVLSEPLLPVLMAN
jgi:nucleotide-binding universal stress UspA family protein